MDKSLYIMFLSASLFHDILRAQYYFNSGDVATILHARYYVGGSDTATIIYASDSDEGVKMPANPRATLTTALKRHKCRLEDRPTTALNIVLHKNTEKGSQPNC
jgi:hypothetical protein